MKKTKDSIVMEMYQAGLLNEHDTSRYLLDESVNASQMNEIKQLILLCKKSEQEIKEGKHYPIHQLIDNLNTRYCQKG